MHMRKTDGKKTKQTNKQTNGSTLQKQNNPEQSLIEICYQHLSYSLKHAVKTCIMEYYIKQPDMLKIWSKFFQK